MRPTLMRPALLIACIGWPGWASAQTSAQVQPTIVASGEASLSVPPDVARVDIAAEARAVRPSDAQQQAAQAMAAVQSAVRALGIPDANVKTTEYTLQPEMDYQNGPRVKDYVARNAIEVRVDDLDKLSGVIDAAGASGATSMSGLRFDVKDRDRVEHEALTAAVKDAMARAQAMAAGAGRTLGAVVRIEEARTSSPTPRPMLMTVGGASAQSTPIQTGQIEIQAQVTVTVEIR